MNASNVPNADRVDRVRKLPYALISFEQRATNSTCNALLPFVLMQFISDVEGDLLRTLAFDVSASRLVRVIADGARVSRGPGARRSGAMFAVVLAHFVAALQVGQSLLDLLELKGVQLIFESRR